MPLFLFEAKYVGKGLARLARDGGTKRAAAMFRLVQSHGETCKYVYFGRNASAIAIATMPNDTAATAVQKSLHASKEMEVSILPLVAPSRLLSGVQEADSLEVLLTRKTPSIFGGTETGHLFEQTPKGTWV